jgi:ABC-type multidrug transport system ATPase subunit
LDQLHLGERTEMNYQGIPNHIMHKELRGEAVYQAEADIHFPQLTVKETLEFAALARVHMTILVTGQS